MTPSLADRGGRRDHLHQRDPHFPWRDALALMEGASGLLPSGGVLVTYGPYRRGGRHTAPSNEEFDASLSRAIPNGACATWRRCRPRPIVRGCSLDEAVAMPANNFTLVFRR